MPNDSERLPNTNEPISHAVYNMEALTDFKAKLSAVVGSNGIPVTVHRHY